MHIQFRSINTKFLTVSLALLALVFGGLGLFASVQNSKALRAALDSKGKAVAELANHAAADYLSNFNYIGLDKFAEDVLTDADVAFIAVYNDKKALVTKQPEPQDVSSLVVNEQVLKDDDRILGSMRIGYRTDAVDKSVRAL